MLRVLYALAPVALTAVYFYGWRFAAMIAVAAIAGFITELIMAQRRDGKVSYACFVTTGLLAVSLTPTTPFWIVGTASVIAILFGKEAFGGFGKNVFNPAIVGRAFAFVSFPVEITSRYVPVFRGFPGGFSRWSWLTQKNVPEYLDQAGLTLADAVSAATPMWTRRDMGFITPVKDLFFGTINGTFQSDGSWNALSAGSGGEVCALVILLAGVYLMWTKTAQWRLIVATWCGAIAMNIFLRYILGMHEAPTIPFTLFSGALMFGSVFMVTDPVSAPKIPLSQWIYGFFIGCMVVFFRAKAIFTGGVLFSILLGNMLSPSLDLWNKRIKAARSSKPEAGTA
ncbi:MAG: electron transporter RnfD [Chitinivibrionales bacterium]|nr:electron transporter RnfD [Chitinivibrionales bacterium]